MQIGIGYMTRGATKPAVRKRVLTIVDVAFLRVASCLVSTKGKVGGTGVHVPHLAVSTFVGRPEMSPQAIISIRGMTSFNNLMQRRFQFCALLAVSGSIIGSRVVGTLSLGIGNSHHHDGQRYE